MADIKKFAEELVNLTVKDVQELAKVSRKSMVSSQLPLLLQLLLPVLLPLLLRKRLNSTLSLRQPVLRSFRS